MKIAALAVLALAVATPALAQTSPSGGIGNLPPPPPPSTTPSPDQAQTPPSGERGGDRPSDEKSPRASH
jgi:hypothetical protein